MNRSVSKTRLRLFAMCPPGLEDILSQELLALGVRGRKVYGGIEFNGDMAALYLVNLWSRVAGRVLVRLAAFRLTNLMDAVDRFARYPWEIYLGSCNAVRIRASCHKSRIYHSGALRQRLGEGISKRLGRAIRVAAESEGSATPLVFARMSRDKCLLSIDSSGMHLHKRGLKKFTVKAPLRENLAAAMLIASGWDTSSTLVDPFCGSGTIVLEAILMAARIPPGRRRRFAFMDWKNFQPDTWASLLKRSDRLSRKPEPEIVGMDADINAVEATLANLEQAGLSSAARIVHGDLSRLEYYYPAGKGFFVTNPPYGRRLKENYALADLYSRFSQLLKDRFPGWRAAVLCPASPRFLRRCLGPALRPVCHFSNGGIKVYLLSG